MKRRLAAALSVLLMLGTAVPAFAEQAAYSQLANAEINESTVTQGGYIYTAVKGFIERINPATNERITVAAQKDAYSVADFSVLDHWVYWYGKNAVYKAKTDGSGLVKLAAGGSGDAAVSNLRVTPKGIFYCLGGKTGGRAVYRMKLDGAGRVKLEIEPVSRFEVDGDFLYYLPEGDETLYRCGLDGGDIAQAARLEGDEWLPEVYNGTVYYPDAGKWYYVNKNNQIKQSNTPSKIPNEYYISGLPSFDPFGATPSRVSIVTAATRKSFALENVSRYSLLGSKEHLYYYQSGDKKGLYRCGWNGKNKEKLADSGTPILLANGYMVYLKGNDIAWVKD